MGIFLFSATGKSIYKTRRIYETFTAIREDLKNIRYYYARRDEMAQKAKILGECTVSKTAEEYNEVVCQAPPKLYELYYCMYVENNTQESAADKYGYAREHITRLNRQLLIFIQNHLTA